LGVNEKISLKSGIDNVLTQNNIWIMKIGETRPILKVRQYIYKRVC